MGYYSTSYVRHRTIRDWGLKSGDVELSHGCKPSAKIGDKCEMTSVKKVEKKE
jgi:hypothetical protein